MMERSNKHQTEFCFQKIFRQNISILSCFKLNVFTLTVKKVSRRLGGAFRQGYVWFSSDALRKRRRQIPRSA